jgi:hypothetical protein
MSVFGNIMSAIFGRASATTAAPAPSAPAAAQPAPADAPPAQPGAAAAAPVDVGAIMDNLAAQSTQRLDWRNSIVDLMKLIRWLQSSASRGGNFRSVHRVARQGSCRRGDDIGHSSSPVAGISSRPASSPRISAPLTGRHQGCRSSVARVASGCRSFLLSPPPARTPRL